jgi:hypothetical protein
MSKAEGKNIALKFTEDITSNVDSLVLPEPSIKGYSLSTSYGSTSTISLPSEASKGDTLILFFNKDDDVQESVAEGWERIFTSMYGYKTTSVHKTIYNGVDTEITLAHDYERTSSIVLCLPPYMDIIVSEASDEYTSTPQPPSLNSGFEPGTQTLWVAFAGCDYRNIIGFPSNFPTNNINPGSYSDIGIASLTSTNTTETPGVFTMSSTDGVTSGVLAIGTQSRDDILAAKLKQGLTITGQEYQYVNGPLIPKEYLLDNVDFHPNYVDNNYLLLATAIYNSFRNVEGLLHIDYDATDGFLVGRGGDVESFSTDFSPLDLVQKPNPGVVEALNITSTVNTEFIEVYYKSAFLDEHINISASVIVDFIDVDIVNP